MRYNFYLTVLVLASLPFDSMASGSREIGQKTKNHLLRTGVEGPSMSETSNFLQNKLRGCGVFSTDEHDVQEQDTSGESHTSQKIVDYHWVAFSISGGILRMTEDTKKKLHRPSFNEKYVSYAERYDAVVRLSDLSPEVEVKNYHGENYAVIRCSSGGCINSSKNFLSEPTNTASDDTAQYFADLSAYTPRSTGGETTNINAFDIDMCGDGSDAERVRRALSHAIQLGGGKRPAF